MAKAKGAKGIKLMEQMNLFLKSPQSTQRAIFFLVFILLVRIFLMEHQSIIHITNFLLLVGLLLLITKDVKRALLYGITLFIIATIIQMSINPGRALYENFTSEDEDNSSGIDEVKKSSGESDNDEKGSDDALRNELAALLKKLEADNASGKSNINTEKLETYTDRLKGKIKVKEDDLEENEPVGIDTSAMAHDEIKVDPLKKAQKETYELIDTIGILKETVQSLNPVLSEGKKVMDLFKGLNMDGMEEGDKGKGLDGLASLFGGKK